MEESKKGDGVFAQAYRIVENIRLGAVQGPFTNNPALLWNDPQGAAAKIADVARAFDVHALEHDPVAPAK